MLTIFATPKPLKGHFAIIQRNAITSWVSLQPRPEIILFGDEEGTAQICRELNLRHIPEVARSEFGTPLLNDIFEKGQRLATHRMVCYVNADIVFLEDFMPAIKNVTQWNRSFLMVGQRWDVDIRELLDFDRHDWQQRLKSLAFESGKQRPPNWIDYFVFPKGVFQNLPSFAVGRPGWDNWFIWNACTKKIPVVDASQAITPVHQNHDYSHHPKGQKGVWSGEEAKRNTELLGSPLHFYTIADAPYRLTSSVVRRNFTAEYFRRKLDVLLFRKLRMLYGSLMVWTRPIRHRLGLRKRYFNYGNRYE